MLAGYHVLILWRFTDKMCSYSILLLKQMENENISSVQFFFFYSNEWPEHVSVAPAGLCEQGRSEMFSFRNMQQNKCTALL